MKNLAKTILGPIAVVTVLSGILIGSEGCKGCSNNDGAEAESDVQLELWKQHEKEEALEAGRRKKWGESMPASPGARTAHEADHAESEWDE